MRRTHPRGPAAGPARCAAVPGMPAGSRQRAARRASVQPQRQQGQPAALILSKDEEDRMSGLLARLRARIPLEEGSLVLITMIWGATFIIIRSALEATGPFFFVGVRFAFAALALI